MELSEDFEKSCDSETKGFDLSVGGTWIYPENYPIRDYQFNIVEAALYKNTLVCLPTGLGKTFIAAVVMYNFWRWYPCGKVVFLAPTKPLVAQQIFACHNTMGIPSAETMELTGAINQKQRQTVWIEKRVIFATPQVFHNDLEKSIIPADLVKCVVIDEAHRALGKHSYCECIRILGEKNQHYRVLALSATPGNKIDNVHEILQNLRIAHLELRDETSSDIIPYVNQRKIDIVLVPLNKELTGYKDRYIFIMDRHVRVLLQFNVLHGHTANISKGRVFYLLKEFQKKTNKTGNYGQIMRTLNILVTMYHAYELMVRNGLRAFHKFYQNHSDKFWMNDEIELQCLLEDIEKYLGSFPEIKSAFGETTIDVPQNLMFGHTKFDKLKELLLNHFTKSKEKDEDTRAIVFVEYRDTVSEIYILLLQCQPLIRPQMFVGQAGQKQKQQIKALENFKNNHVNVLISTSIGEEGLDVGEVDLIICFDISQRSPTRLVQRMGRTGRKRDGHIIILVTDGKEYDTLKSTMARRDSMNRIILNANNIDSSLYQNNPRMIPNIYTPECLKMRISVQPKSPTTKRRTKKQKLDKKDNKRQHASHKSVAIDSNLGSLKEEAKFSLIKFFKNEGKNEQAVYTSQIPSSNATEASNGGPIKPSDVKILSCDNDAIDFLTLCALRNSERETNIDEKYEKNICQCYIPKFSSVKEFPNFTIPDVKILECLYTINNIIPQNCEENNIYNKNTDENSSNHSGWYNDFDTPMNAMNEMDNKDFAEESRFEDLLDDSSESYECSTATINEETHRNIDTRLDNESTNFSDRFSKQHASISETGIKNAGTLEDLKPGIFENLLSESSDESESATLANNFKLQSWNEIIDISDNVKPRTSNDNVKKMVKSGTLIETSLQLKATKANNTFIEFDSCKRYLEDCAGEKNDAESKVCESKEHSALSITQAITEIARINSSANCPNTVGGSEDDMFLERDPKVEITNEKEILNWKLENTIKNNKSRNATDIEGWTDFDDVQSIKGTNTEFTIEEYDWNDDFEVSADPVNNCSSFNSFKHNTDESNKRETDLENLQSSTEQWISMEKSFNTSRISSMTIAKKLAVVKRQCEYVKGQFRDKRSPEKERNINAKYHKVSVKSEEVTNITGQSSSNSKSICKSKKVRAYEFIDDQAEVSSNDSADESSGTDNDLESFISHTQNVLDTTDMHAYYLQTVRSPVKRKNVFVFKEPKKHSSSIELYSQAVSDEYDSYGNDSFVVEDGEEEDEFRSIRNEEVCVLEQAEQKLSERRKRKRKRFLGKKISNNAKKRRNIINDCSSSENEAEKMRKEIQDESLLLKQAKYERN